MLWHSIGRLSGMTSGVEPGRKGFVVDLWTILILVGAFFLPMLGGWLIGSELSTELFPFKVRVKSTATRSVMFISGLLVTLTAFGCAIVTFLSLLELYASGELLLGQILTLFGIYPFTLIVPSVIIYYGINTNRLIGKGYTLPWW